MKRQAYKPQSARRVYIPKPGTDKQRPLGIPAYEDKLVRATLAKILNAIYEQDFLECSFGFRPNRGCHDALKVLDKIVNIREINYVVDLDIKAFFDNVDHEWLKRFIHHRIADTNLLRLISRFLRAGIIEAGNLLFYENDKTSIEKEAAELSFYSYCLKNSKGYLLKGWDTEKNLPLRPEKIGSTNTARVWWKCAKGHEWQTQLSSRARGNSGCPVCIREKIDQRVAKRRADETKKRQKKQEN